MVMPEIRLAAPPVGWQGQRMLIAFLAEKLDMRKAASNSSAAPARAPSGCACMI